MMSIQFYPAKLSPYPVRSLAGACRVDPRDYPVWDGICLTLGPVGVSINWQRK